MKQAWLVVAAACSKSPDPAPGVVLLDPAPVQAYEVQISVIRWACAQHESDGYVDTQLHVPTDTPLRLVFDNHDREDLDVDVAGVPVHARHGSYAMVALRFERPGSYAWTCPTQQPDHPRETPPIVAQSMNDYLRYHEVQRSANRPQTREGKIALGKTLYERKGCNSCHTTDGSPHIGTSLAGLWGTQGSYTDGTTKTVDAVLVQASLAQPQAYVRNGFPPSMPSYEGQLKAHEIEALVVFIESLATARSK